MAESEAMNGVPVTAEQIAEWAAEAEAGLDVAELKRRGRGRPGRGAVPSQVHYLANKLYASGGFASAVKCSGRLSFADQPTEIIVLP